MSQKHSTCPPPLPAAVIGLSVPCRSQLPGKRFDFAARMDADVTRRERFAAGASESSGIAVISSRLSGKTLCDPHMYTFSSLLDDQGDQGPLLGDH